MSPTLIKKYPNRSGIDQTLITRTHNCHSKITFTWSKRGCKLTNIKTFEVGKSTSTQTIMSGICARMSLRLDALEILSVSLEIKLSQPETKVGPKLQQELKRKRCDSLRLVTFYFAFQSCRTKREVKADGLKDLKAAEDR